MDSKSLVTELIDRILAGDETAFVPLLADHTPLLEAVVRHALNPGNSVRPYITTQDILQSVLFRLAEKAKLAQGGDRPNPAPTRDGLALIRTIAARLVVDRGRRVRPDGEGRAVGLSEADIAAMFADPAPGPAEVAASRDTARHLLDQLSPAHRRATELRAEGRTWPEIAGPAADKTRLELERRWAELDDPTESAP